MYISGGHLLHVSESLPSTYIVWMLIWCTAKYGYIMQFFGGLGMRNSIPLRPCLCSLNCLVTQCSSGMRLVVWGRVG